MTCEELRIEFGITSLAVVNVLKKQKRLPSIRQPLHKIWLAEISLQQYQLLCSLHGKPKFPKIDFLCAHFCNYFHKIVVL